MECNDIIILVEAVLVGGGTITLAIMTWRAIRQTRYIQRRERKNRLLNEIRDWIFSIKDITLEPMTEDNLFFRHLNIEFEIWRSFEWSQANRTGS